MSIAHKKVSTTQVVLSRSCRLMGFLVGTDGTNDPTITMYDGTATSGNEVVPTNTYDASLLGLNGFMMDGSGIICDHGVYCEITCVGAVEVVVYYK